MEERCRKIRLLLLDVDGVLTDGRIIYDNNGLETKAFDVKDGHGLKLVQRAGIKVGIITGRESRVVEHRAAELGIAILYQGAKDKLLPYEEILAQQGLRDEEVAYVGDDVVDLPVLSRVGLAVTVQDAVDDIKPYVHYVTRRPGGRGAVREVCDLILKESQRWEAVAGRYFSSVPQG
ncbi:3-deoxy-manno-octulosonate-8-phosphatase KdsC [Geoalkalibacter halelectricus]|uniref:3-deoxy-manno-octulosonate-8-phosphatase KdsC n=1 Tax=Geoalkalibacter halelectricus TaxID=2847045 RepID=UPI003D1CD885